MSQNSIHVVSRLTNVEYAMIAKAAAASDMTIAAYLTTSAVRQAHASGVTAPYLFEGQVFATDALSDAWYDAATEDELLIHLKAALSARDLETASAMAIELLDFPTNWSSLEARAEWRSNPVQPKSPIDHDLAMLVASVVGSHPVSPETNAWECYKAILKAACERQPLAAARFEGSGSPGTAGCRST